MELFLLVLMIVLIVGLVLWVKLPVGLSLLATAAVMAGIGTRSFPLKQLVEGMFGYLDVCLLLVAAMIFLAMIERNGLLERLTRDLIVLCGKSPSALLVSLTLIIMFPGAITGSCTASVLGTGTVVTPIFRRMGIPTARIGAIISTSAVFGMIAPPVNIPVLAVCGGIDMPYIGFTGILALMTVPSALLCTFFFAYGYARKTDLKSIVAEVRQQDVQKGFAIYIPLVVVVVMMLLPKAFPGLVPDIGLAATFALGAVCSAFFGRKFNVLESARTGTTNILGVVGILFGVGALIEIMTMTGVRGEIVTLTLNLPQYLTIPAIVAALPVFGGVSVYGSASVLGVPFVLADIGQNLIVTTSAVSLLASIGSYLPPVALTSVIAAQLLGEKSYVPISKQCAFPSVLSVALAVFMLVNANAIAKMVL
jgi:TRAP-type C4-dicarboxylate transport system, large permease component